MSRVSCLLIRLLCLVVLLVPVQLSAEQADGVAVSGAVMPPGITILPSGPLDDPWLGIGLSGISDWSTQHPFIDLMKTARPWLGHTANQWGAWDAARLEAEGYLDADGWLTAMPPDLARVEALILTDQPPEAVSLAGRYRVTFDGTGAVTVVGLATDVTRDADGIWFSYAPGPGLVAVSISATDPADPVRNITVMRADLIPAYDAGERFNPDWLRVVSDMRSLRFMDWMQTNGSTQVSWSDRPLPHDYTYARRGVPVEVMVALANRVGADPWVTLPHQADDVYVATFATYMRDHLRLGLMVYAEWSNEVWNSGFPQAAWAEAQATARWGDQAENAWMQFAGLRAAQVADIWARVFGAAADDRLVRVIATHTAWLGLEDPLLNAPLAQAEGLPAPYLSFEAYAVTGYFGHDIASETAAPQLRDWIARGTAVQEVTQTLLQGSVNMLLTEIWPHQAAVAQDYGLRLVMYEGGTHLVGQGQVVDDPAITDFLTRYNYSPEMAGLYATIMTGWQEVGGTMFNQFVDVGNPSKWGSWGALRHLDDMNPRWATLAAFNAGMPVTWENRAQGTFADQPVIQQ